MSTARDYDLEDRLIQFAVRVCDLAERLPRNDIGGHVAGQLIRCATAPASNYAEAQSAESRRDFIHKMKVCLKELHESRIWLKFLEAKGLCGNHELVWELRESNELISICVCSVKTATMNDRASEMRISSRRMPARKDNL